MAGFDWVPIALSYRLIQKGVLVHAGDHLAQHLTVREPNKFKQWVPAVRNLEMPCSGLNAGTRFLVPWWDQIRQ